MQAPATEEGFTLVELVTVIAILGILVGIAVPTYMTYSTAADVASAQANVRSAISAAEGYYLTGATYTGMTSAKLQKQSPGISLSHVTVSSDGFAYCVDSQVSGATHEAYYIGGDQNIASDHHGFAHDTGVRGAATKGHACSDEVSG